MAKDSEYPIHFKKIVDGAVMTAYAHNKDEKSKFEADGYFDQESSQWQRTGAPSFPSLMYAKDGSTAVCKDQSDQDAKIKAGYSVKPIIRAEVAPAATGTPAAPDTRIDDLEKSVKSLSEGMARILEALGEPKQGKKAS